VHPVISLATGGLRRQQRRRPPHNRRLLHAHCLAKRPPSGAKSAHAQLPPLHAY
jgi:hypothetical protein